jgi:hypothetical protein
VASQRRLSPFIPSPICPIEKKISISVNIVQHPQDYPSMELNSFSYSHRYVDPPSPSSGSAVDPMNDDCPSSSMSNRRRRNHTTEPRELKHQKKCHLNDETDKIIDVF